MVLVELYGVGRHDKWKIWWRRGIDNVILSEIWAKRYLMMASIAFRMISHLVHISLFFLLRFPLFLEIDSVVSPTLPTLITCSIHSATSIISIKLVDSFSNK
jgi:hypothetical protein